MGKFRSTKLFDGYSCCFRQWKAKGSHCEFLHGYGVSFKCTFEGDLDERNWVWDFGGMKRSKGTMDRMKPEVFFKWLLDHTVIAAEDDPMLAHLKMLDAGGVIQLRVLPAVGAEKFAEYLFKRINKFIKKETNGRVKLIQVEFMENGKNSAIYSEASGSILDVSRRRSKLGSQSPVHQIPLL